MSRSPTPSEVLRFIAEAEPLDRTLGAFPGLPRGRVAAWLLELADIMQGKERQLHDASPEPDASPDAGGEQPAPARSAAPAATPSPVGAASGDVAAVRVYSDGAARGNPGPAGAGAVVTDSEGRVLARLGKYLGRQTNNHAEYMGLILGLEHARGLGAREVSVFADSQLLIRQLEGRYRVKSETLQPLFDRARALLKGFRKVRLEHIPREDNELADEMSNRAIDERL